MMLAGTVITIAVTMALVASTYAFMDYTQSPKFLMKYKVQTGKNVPPDTKKMMKVHKGKSSCQKYKYLLNICWSMTY